MLATVTTLMTLSAIVLTWSGNLVVVAAAQVVLGLIVVIASIYVTGLLHDSVPSSVRSGVASGVGALSWLVFLPFALVFGVVSNAEGVHAAGWMLVATAVLASATLTWVSLRPRPHREIVDLIPGHIDGTLDALAEQRVVEHLATCEACATFVDQMRQTIRALGTLPPERLPGEVRDTLLASLRSRTGRAPVTPGLTAETSETSQEEEDR